MIERFLVNGELSDGAIPITDSSVLRGDGCFEVIKSYRGVPYRLDDHLDRLTNSARLLELTLPSRGELRAWVEDVTPSEGDAAIRIVVTRGSAVPGVDGEPLTIVFSHSWEVGEGAVSLLPVSAPWHPAGEPWELGGSKLLSYAPNMAVTRRARSEGYDEALLTTPGGMVLEGPTYSVAWTVDGVLETPTLDLGILESVTRRVMLELAEHLGIPVTEGVWDLERFHRADEVLIASTIRELQPVVAVGSVQFEPGSITRMLKDAFAQSVGS